MPTYVWQHPHWHTRWRWDADALLVPVGTARRRLGELLGRASTLGVAARRDREVDALTAEAVSTSAVEGERLDVASVASSVARRLGLRHAGLTEPRQRKIEGLVEVVTDATRHPDRPLTAERLHGWQAALFPTGRSGITPITVGAWHPGPDPMRVVSQQADGDVIVHYEAPPPDELDAEMRAFLTWFESTDPPDDGLLRAGLAHVWFEPVHPYQDGNGRVGRAIADLALARDDRATQRLYSLSRQILDERPAYYTALQAAQRGDGDLTAFLTWFAGCVTRAITRSLDEIDRALDRQAFWMQHRDATWNERQRKVLDRLLDAGPGGFEGGITPRKHRNLTGVSEATAHRDLVELHDAGVLRRTGAGRSTSYALVWPERTPLVRPDR